MEKILQQILKKLDKLDGLEERLERLEPLVEESYQWLKALVESNEVHRAEMDNINNHLARVEGVLAGFDKSLEPLRKAQ